MTSKIDSLTAAGMRQPDPTPTRVASARTADTPAVASPDRVALTADAQNLAVTRYSAAAQPAPIDHAKVASLRLAIENGTYKVDPQAIASRLIDIDKALP